MRIKSQIHWPEIKEQGALFRHVYDFISKLRKTLDQRDKKIALAINANDIEVVTSVPSGEPDYGEPALKLYYSGSTYRLYAYVDGDWRYVGLT